MAFLSGRIFQTYCMFINFLVALFRPGFGAVNAPYTCLNVFMHPVNDEQIENTQKKLLQNMEILVSKKKRLYLVRRYVKWLPIRATASAHRTAMLCSDMSTAIFTRQSTDTGAALWRRIWGSVTGTNQEQVCVTLIVLTQKLTTGDFCTLYFMVTCCFLFSHNVLCRSCAARYARSRRKSLAWRSCHGNCLCAWSNWRIWRWGMASYMHRLFCCICAGATIVLTHVGRALLQLRRLLIQRVLCMEDLHFHSKHRVRSSR